MRFCFLLFLSGTLFFSGAVLVQVDEAEANMTLEAIRVSDYVSYSHVALELSNTKNSIRIEPIHSSNTIRVRLRACSRGEFGNIHKVDSSIVNDIQLGRDSTKGWLVVDIPVNNNVDLKRLHWHRWNNIFTIDIPLHVPNHSRIPTDKEIADFKRRGGKVVVIDPGHGGHHPGSTGGSYTRRPRMLEKDVVLDLGFRLKKLIDQDPQLMGLMTRTNDYLPVPFGVEGVSRNQYNLESLEYRVQLAKEYHGDIYVSLHLNGIHPSNQRSTRGFMVFTLGDMNANRIYEDSLSDTYLKEEGMALVDVEEHQQVSQVVSALMKDTVTSNSKVLAANIAREMSKVPGLQMNTRYIRQANFKVLRHLSMPSVLVEFLYLTHPAEHEYVRKATNRQYLVKALFQAIRNYFPKVETNTLLASQSIPSPTPIMNKVDPLRDTLMNLEAVNEEDDPIQALQEELNKEIQNQDEINQEEEPTPTEQTTDTSESEPENPKEEQSQEPHIYTVQRGDTLTSIAKAFDSTVQDIKALNQLSRSDVITPNQKLKIPGEGTVIPDNVNPAPVYVEHTVQRGENLHIIAKRYKTTISSIKDLNRLRSDTIQIGKKLKIHRGYQNGNRITSQQEEYKVRKGDTLSEIADKFGVSIHEIRRTNGIRGSRIHPGQVLRINL